MADRLFDEVTVGQLCKGAACSVGSFYGRVESKDALLEHLRTRIYTEAAQSLEALADPAFASSRTLSELVREQARALVRFHITRRGAIKALVVQARRDHGFGEHTRAFNGEVLRRVSGSWLAHRDAIHHPNPELAVEQAALMVAGYLRESIVFGDLWPTEIELDEDAWVEQLHRLVLAVLCTPEYPS